MATFRSTPTSTLNVQPRIAGDMALLRGVAKHLLESLAHDPKAIDRAFLERHTHGFDAYRSAVESTTWPEIEHRSGVPEAKVREMGEVYRKSRAAIIAWCLGVTQQEHAVDTIREIVNVLLLRGNIGRGLITSILSDDAARGMIFGRGNLFEQTGQALGRPTTAKSGTTNDW